MRGIMVTSWGKNPWQRAIERSYSDMSTPNITRWIGIGLLGLPLYGVMTFFSSIDPQPDPNTHYEAWARFVTTDGYALKHLFLTLLGTIFGIFGSIALGVYLTRTRAGGMGLWAMLITVLGYALFLTWAGVSTFAAPFEGQIVLAGMEEEIDVLPGVAVWRSGILPKWAGALWAFAPVLMYIFGLVYAMTIGAQATPPTVPAGAVLLTISGAWIAWSALSRPDAAQVEGVGAQPRVQ